MPPVASTTAFGAEHLEPAALAFVAERRRTARPSVRQQTDDGELHVDVDAR